MRIGLVPRRNRNQPRRAVKTVQEQLGLPAMTRATGIHDGSAGVESLFDAEALVAFESRLQTQNDSIAKNHQGVTAMQKPQKANAHVGSRVAAEKKSHLSHSASIEPRLLHPAQSPQAPDPNLDLTREFYSPTWQTRTRNSNK